MELYSTRYRQLIERYISPKDIWDNFPAVEYLNALGPVLPYRDQRLRPIKLGSLWWPQGATRWATGHFLATDKGVAAMRAALGYDLPNFILNPAPLILSDGNTTITANMWMLPPRPLFQNPMNPAVSATNSTVPLTKWLLPVSYNSFPLDALGNTTEPPGEQLYLLTFVDDRYMWWQKSSTVSLNPGTTTWASLFSQIGTNLNVGITTDTISADYGTPGDFLLPYLQFLPVVLDLAAFAVGQRLVRALDGTVSLQNATTAMTSVDTQLATVPNPAMGGGIFAFDLS